MERDWLEFWVLELNDIPVAAQSAFRYRDTCYSLQEGFDPSYDAESVGFVLRTRTMQRLIDLGVRRYNFLGGVNESKLRWGAVAGELAESHVRTAAYPGGHVHTHRGNGTPNQRVLCAGFFRNLFSRPSEAPSGFCDG